MKVSGTATLHAPVEAVWTALNDPAVLVRTIPGCERLEQTGPDRYRMTVVAGVASIKGSYQGDVALTDQDPPGRFVLRASGAGAPGTVSAEVNVRLEPDGEDTRLTYDADAVVGGPVGGVGQRVLSGVAKKTAGEFFRAVDDVLTGAERAPEPVAVGAPGEVATDAQPVAVPAEGSAPTVFTAPAAASSARDPLEVPFWIVLAGVGAGAFWALVGVAVGYRLSRGQRNG